MDVYFFIIRKILPTLIVFVLAIGIIGYAGDKLGLLSLGEFGETVSENIRKILNIEQEEKNEEENDGIALEVALLIDKPREIYESRTDVSFYTNKEITLVASERFSLNFIKQEVNKYWYVVEVKNIGTGDSNIKFEVKDSSGNLAQLEQKVTRKSFTLPFGGDFIEMWPDSKYTIAESNDLLSLVDKKNRLPNDYDPGTLVNISTDLQLYANSADMDIRSDAGNALRSMLLDLQTQKGKTITIISAYRPYNLQIDTYTQNVRALGQEKADNISARPGYSEHQLGTVIDLYSPDTATEYLSKEFDNTVAGQWLKENAYKYGYVQTYTQGAESLTGYEFEPWHWRFIGIENAKELKESGKTFTEWAKGK